MYVYEENFRISIPEITSDIGGNTALVIVFALILVFKIRSINHNCLIPGFHFRVGKGDQWIHKYFCSNDLKGSFNLFILCDTSFLEM